MEIEKNNKSIKKKVQLKILRLFLTITIFLVLFVVAYAIIKFTGIWDKINSIEKLKKIVESGGKFSFVVFVILQIFQTIIL